MGYAYREKYAISYSKNNFMASKYNVRSPKHSTIVLIRYWVVVSKGLLKERANFYINSFKTSTF